jgi:uncharacterized protein (UPF0332 family)
MTPETVALIRYRVARAKEALAEATLLLAHNHVSTAVNRLYYAGFYAVSALLLTEGYSSPKHSGIRALFDRHWIASGRLPKDLGRLYRRLFDARQKGDYADLVVFDPAEVRAWRDDMDGFFRAIAHAVEEQLRAGPESAPA